MDDLIFNRQIFNTHYNCALYDVESIPIQERQHPIHGAYGLGIAILLETMCGLCLYAISRPQHISSASYKLMFALELSEMIEIVAVGVAVPIMGFVGHVYCSNPVISYVHGSIGIYIWYFEGQISVVLAFNRCLIMYDANYARKLFEGYKVFFYIIFAIVSSTAMLCYGPPVLYSGVGGGNFFDPHVGYRPPDPYFFNKLHFIFNHVIAVALIAIYVVFGILIYGQQKLGQRRRVIAKKEISLFLQISIICFLTVLSCVGYAYVGFFDQYKIFVTVTTDAYLLYLGSPAFVYLLLNKSIRRDVANLMFRACNRVASYDVNVRSTNQKNTVSR
ncbi:serpentine type 7TM GPCR chemoreceptor srt domain-containing protein [Ditylenchus destructor]|uniref:Serpentine type 7TM GPCR chemoreceptor srt domain-containing protein n=1 Tax=Ditylenchus destructor TaxID=166010 RepID=A0AAD4MFX7_9BILA|nr:serpentine type 7TM GPCR chemoreceptor srt domain-containing protein [Ditylenchus destructor]